MGGEQMSYGTQGLGRARGRRVAVGYPAQYSIGNASSLNAYQSISDSAYALLERGEDGNGIAPTDSGYYRHTLTLSGDTTCTTAQFKRGAGGVALDGTGDYLSAPAHFGWDVRGEDFLFECWMRPAGLTTDFGIFEMRVSATQKFKVLANSSGQVEVSVGGLLSSLPGAAEVTSTSTLAKNQWTHIRTYFDVSADTLYIQIDGTQEDSSGAGFDDTSYFDYSTSTPTVGYTVDEGEAEVCTFDDATFIVGAAAVDIIKTADPNTIFPPEGWPTTTYNP